MEVASLAAVICWRARDGAPTLELMMARARMSCGWLFVHDEKLPSAVFDGSEGPRLLEGRPEVYDLLLRVARLPCDARDEMGPACRVSTSNAVRRDRWLSSLAARKHLEASMQVVVCFCPCRADNRSHRIGPLLQVVRSGNHRRRLEREAAGSLRFTY